MDRKWAETNLSFLFPVKFVHSSFVNSFTGWWRLTATRDLDGFLQCFVTTCRENVSCGCCQVKFVVIDEALFHGEACKSRSRLCGCCGRPFHGLGFDR